GSAALRRGLAGHRLLPSSCFRSRSFAHRHIHCGSAGAPARRLPRAPGSPFARPAHSPRQPLTPNPVVRLMNFSLCRRGLAVALLALPAAAQGQEPTSLVLNGPLARGDTGYVNPVSISPDGEFFVYTTAYPSPFPPQPNRPSPSLIYELHSVASRGKRQPRLLNAGSLSSVQVTLDSRGVLFAGDADGNGSFDLQLVPIDGSAPARVLGDPLLGSVAWFEESPGDGHVVYMAGVNGT